MKIKLSGGGERISEKPFKLFFSEMVKYEFEQPMINTLAVTFDSFVIE